ncbi:aspartate/glutamate racemase family protein [Salmonella enterica subsp. enterica serovar Sandiego]|nr:aspartate/glutamate racemase family protein [Salmonella enterica subsp. enterica serovar Sandiego]
MLKTRITSYNLIHTMNLPVIGIVGGMGIKAALAFNQLLIDSWPVSTEDDFPRIILDNLSSVPSRYEALTQDRGPLLYTIAKCIDGLKLSGADVIVLPCNAIHYFYHDIINISTLPVFNMIEQVSSVLKDKVKQQRVLVIGAYITTEFQLYSKWLTGCQYLGNIHKQFFYDLIIQSKYKTVDISTTLQQEKIFSILSQYEVDHVLLACTELSFLKETLAQRYSCFDSNEVYAQAIIECFKKYS